MDKYTERIYNGIVKENPTFVIMLGMCPTLATTTNALNGLGMGLSTTAVLMFSNLLISVLRKIIPDRMRLPGEIVVVASLVTIVQLLIQAYVPWLYEALGIYIPLIVVNCIILGRAEAYALSHEPMLSFMDGLGMGIGFTLALTVIGAVRELIGAGTIFNFRLIPEAFSINIFVLAPGAFLVLAVLTAIQNKLKLPSATNGDAPADFVCAGNCMGCFGSCESKEPKSAAKPASQKKESAAVSASEGAKEEAQKPAGRSRLRPGSRKAESSSEVQAEGSEKVESKQSEEEKDSGKQQADSADKGSDLKESPIGREG